MKKNDLVFALCMILIFAPFLLFDEAFRFYSRFNTEHGMIMSFVKFGILASMGELLGLRIKTGSYYAPHFGILPRAVIWGLIGLSIKLAFVVFTRGTIAFLVYMGIDRAVTIFSGPLSGEKVLIAFCISAAMNVIYAPVMMTFHRVTDAHIGMNGGRLKALITPMRTGKILSEINWKAQWSFVFARTIPLFWIPAHTITFLLPEAYQVLFAALLGIALGVILAIAAKLSRN